MSNISPLLNILSKSTRQIGKTIIRDFVEIEKLDNSSRGKVDFVKKSIDNLKERFIKNLIKIRKDFKIKSINDFEDPDCWILDTIDNPINFSRGLSDFCICIAFKEKDEISACVIYSPIYDDTYFFQNGTGGYQNDVRIRVSKQKSILETCVGIFKKYNSVDDKETINIIRSKLTEKSIEIRESGSNYLDCCYVGNGKYDISIVVNPSPNQLSINSLIMRETGGIVHKIDTCDSDIYLFGNKYIGKFLKEMIENKDEKK
ncbi:MAG: Inositol-1-monophosphatase [Alphaproteobacteria bacterium MarineAlpha8_Bin1]|nr:MAG: Inositol-1-monophosphatase [Alphaproteobacteria bacterium MarineAlpha8_Bin1]|tara:strand:+ start:152 stop:928 length:777 start_codon:yes stop_codon:yes gene_type:complete